MIAITEPRRAVATFAHSTHDARPMLGTVTVKRARGHRPSSLRCWLSAGVLVGLVGCSQAPSISPRDAADANDTGAKLTATTESDRLLLTELPKLPPQAPRRMGDNTVVAEAPYLAASGRTCRAIHVDGISAQAGSRHRLACSNGSSWFFVPDVFGAGGE
jgi:hypothetical protein